MQIAETVTFGGGGLDRAEDLRRHPDTLATLAVRTLPLWRGKPLVNAARDGLHTIDGPAFEDHGFPVLIGRAGDSVIVARDVSSLPMDGDDDRIDGFSDDSEQTHPDLPPGTAFVGTAAGHARVAAP